MHPKKSLVTLALGLSLIGGIVGTPAAHAGVTVGPVGTVTPSFPHLHPFIKATIGYGSCSATITRMFFTPDTPVILRMVDLSQSRVSVVHTSASATGTISVHLDWGVLSPHFKARAKDVADGLWSNTLNRHATCIHWEDHIPNEWLSPVLLGSGTGKTSRGSWSRGRSSYLDDRVFFC